MTNHYIITLFSAILLYSAVIFSQTDSLSDTTVDTSASKIPDDTAASDTSIAIDSTIPDSISITAEKDKAKDTLVSDSLEKVERRNFFLRNNIFFRRIYQKYPQSLDSLYNTSIFYPFRIYQADGMNLSEIIFFHPSYTSIPVALSSNLNRFLYYGFPAMHVSMYADYSLFNYYADPTVGPNLYSAAEMKSIQFSSPGNIYFNQQPSLITKPETSIFWENGVFRENILNIRFARPFAERFHIGIFSNYQYFRRQSFNHQAGGMYSFYKGVYKLLGYVDDDGDVDTSYVSYKGTNPLTDEHVSSLRLAWTAKNGTETRFSYKYADIHNDLATEYYTDTTKDTTALAWEMRSHYDHHVQAHLLALPIGKHLRIHAEGFLQKNVNRISPVSTAISGYPVRRGESMSYGGGIKPFIGFNSIDTLAITVNVRRDEIERNDKSRLVNHYTRAALTFTQHYTLLPINLLGTAKGGIGYAFVNVNEKLEPNLTWHITLTHTLGNQNLKLFALQDILPPTIPYDNAIPIFPGNLTDGYQSYGAESELRFKKIGLNLGYCYMYDVSPLSVDKAWPHQIAPYEEPRWVVTVTPILGQWHGLSLFSQWMFSETKPLIKSKSILSCHSNREKKAMHLFIDFGINYWSEREPVYYAGITKWHRPILDLNVKTTIQIKTFRLFYKIDNVLNSPIAYVPGYFMPGLIFRWGFNWLIQG